MKEIQIVVVSDDKYAQHLGVMLYSLFENSGKNNGLIVSVIDGGISKQNKDKLKKIADNFDNTILDFKEIDGNKYNNFGLRNNMSKAAYYKLSIPAIFDKSIKKVIFLDCDLIVEKDIAELWELDVTNYYLAAVKQPFFDRYQELGIPKGSDTFNSGVMVLNLEKWRNEEISEKAFQFLQRKSHNITFHDQDGLNAVLFDKWKKIDKRWNIITSMIFGNLFDVNNENPFITHFTSAKPWYYMNDHPLRDRYYHYLHKTPWRDFVPPEKQICEELLKKNKIVVFGVGKGGERVTRRLKAEGISINYYIDNNENYWGNLFYDKPIKSPNSLLQERKNNIGIFVASYNYYDEIKMQLENFGFIESKHFIPGLGYR